MRHALKGDGACKHRFLGATNVTDQEPGWSMKLPAVPVITMVAGGFVLWALAMKNVDVAARAKKIPLSVTVASGAWTYIRMVDTRMGKVGWHSRVETRGVVPVQPLIPRMMSLLEAVDATPAELSEAEFCACIADCVVARRLQADSSLSLGVAIDWPDVTSPRRRLMKLCKREHPPPSATTEAGPTRRPPCLAVAFRLARNAMIPASGSEHFACPQCEQFAPVGH
jgi:hypothetical protein